MQSIFVYIEYMCMCIYTTILNVSVTCSYDSTVFRSMNAVVEAADKR